MIEDELKKISDALEALVMGLSNRILRLEGKPEPDVIVPPPPPPEPPPPPPSENPQEAA